jgi:hypothetical protein
MLNLFAFRATEPSTMKAQPDPVGPDAAHGSGSVSPTACSVEHGNALAMAQAGTHQPIQLPTRWQQVEPR